MTRPDLTRDIAAAGAGLSLIERLVALIRGTPEDRARRMLARAGRLNARSITANPRRAAKLRARASMLAAAAADLVRPR